MFRIIHILSSKSDFVSKSKMVVEPISPLCVRLKKIPKHFFFILFYKFVALFCALLILMLRSQTIKTGCLSTEAIFLVIFFLSFCMTY